MTNYLDLPIGDKSPEIVTAVVEIPLDSVNKYEYDKTLHVFRLDATYTLQFITQVITASSRKPWRKMLIPSTSWSWATRRPSQAASIMSAP